MQKIIFFYLLLLKDTKIWIKYVATIFTLGFGVGIVTALANPKLLVSVLAGLVQELGINRGLTFEVALNIFWHNLLAFGFVLFGGLFFGLGSVAITLFNGFLTGHILALPFFYSINGYGQTLLFMTAAIIPHGVIEFPAFIVAGSFGLKLGVRWLLPSSSGKRGTIFMEDFLAIWKLMPATLVILFLAAVVEVFVSGRLIENLIG